MPQEDDQVGTGDDAGVLSPDELDITRDENAVEIEDGRYVISAGSDPPSVPSSVTDATSNDAPGETSSPPSTTSGPPGSDEDVAPGSSAREELTEAQARAWLEKTVGNSRSQYGFDVTAKFETTVSRRELYSNDVSTTFENLLVWYAEHVGGDTPVEEVLAILLMEANVAPRYPQSTLEALVRAYGLTPEDSIADLLEAADDRHGVPFPP